MSEILRSEIAEKDKWDLTRIYKSMAEFEKDFQEVEELVKKLVSYKGKIMASSDNLYEVLEIDRNISEKLHKLYIYATLLYYEDMTNNDSDALRLRIEKLDDEISISCSFIRPEMLKTDYKSLVAQKEELKEYEFSLEMLYRYQDYTLSEKEEEILSNAGAAMGSGSDAYSKMNNADFELGYIVDDKGQRVKFNYQLFMEFIRSSDRNLRKRATNKMYDFYESRKHTIASLYAGSVKENTFFSKIRGYNSPLEKSLFADNIPVSVYKNLIDTTHENLPALHKYFELKRKMLGLKKMHMYDVYAEPKFEADEHIEFEKAREMINEALKPLGETYINDLQKAYEERWIDIYPNKGKRSGAYQWGPYQIPFVSLNYNYKVEDVSTAAHELGHAMHTYYSDMTQSSIYNDYPIFLAEIASTVNEVLLSEYLLTNAKSKEEKTRYLLDFLEKTRATIYRQVMFAEYEMLIHDFEVNGEPLTEELLCDTYQDLNKKYFGNKVVSDEYIRYEWMRIPHFYTSFYVYKYATGLAAAIAIATDIIKGVPGTKDKYLDFLKSGCSKYPLDTLNLVGIDLTKKEPIEKAFEYFNEKVEELSSILEEK